MFASYDVLRGWWWYEDILTCVVSFTLTCRQTVKEDKALIVEDWKESILPLLDSAPLKLNPRYFSVKEYFAVRTLIASRSFEIDNYHGFGMVPLADLYVMFSIRIVSLSCFTY